MCISKKKCVPLRSKMAQRGHDEKVWYTKRSSPASNADATLASADVVATEAPAAAAVAVVVDVAEAAATTLARCLARLKQASQARSFSCGRRASIIRRCDEHESHKRRPHALHVIHNAPWLRTLIEASGCIIKVTGYLPAMVLASKHPKGISAFHTLIRGVVRHPCTSRTPPVIGHVFVVRPRLMYSGLVHTNLTSRRERKTHQKIPGKLCSDVIVNFWGAAEVGVLTLISVTLSGVPGVKGCRTSQNNTLATAHYGIRLVSKPW